jgi:CHRD domain
MRPTLVMCLLVFGCGPRSVKVSMNPDNNSGQAGSALVTELGAKSVRVQVSIKKSDVPEAEAAHIHQGRCGMVGPISAGLTPLGLDPADETLFSSDTTVTFDFAQLVAGPFAINVHDSRDLGLYVSCGDIRL